ncbi:MAG TPA: hypothetical protein VEO96_01300 [Thermoplasmata archaeon]|nr:hypothetical protein [Thermoplasmata archaeon]
MRGSAGDRGGRQECVLAIVLTFLLVVGSAFGVFGVSLAPARSQTIRLAAQAAFTVSLSFSPNPVSAGTQMQISLQFNGGSAPFTVWVNGSAPGCAPQQIPFTTPNYSNNFSCTPTSSGTYNVHVDAIDTSGSQGSAASTLTVNTGSGGCTTNCGGNNGSGSGSGNGTGGFSLPEGLVTTLFTFALVFFAGLFALAGGVIAMAVLISRRLRQLTEAMKPPEMAPPESKPPS